FRRRGQMRSDDDVLQLEQRPRVRLCREDVERDRRDLAGARGFEQRLLVDELAARRVDDPHAVAHLRKRPSAEKASGLLIQRQVQREEISFGENLLRALGALDPELAKSVFRDEGVVREDAHLEPNSSPRDLLADAAEAENPERLSRQLDPTPARALPASLLERGVRLRNVAGECEQEANRVLRGREDRGLRCVRDNDPAARRRLDVDVVDSDARAADHLQPLAALDQVRGQLRRRPDDDRVVIADRLREVGLGVDVDVEALPEELDARLRDRFADENSRQVHTRAPSAYASRARVTATPRSMSAPASARPNSTAARAVVMSNRS